MPTIIAESLTLGADHHSKMPTKLTKLAKAFYHDEISDDKLEYFASGGKGQGTQCDNDDFDLDIQKVPIQTITDVLRAHLTVHPRPSWILGPRRSGQQKHFTKDALVDQAEKQER